ncbi:hypothetical protein N7532_009701 [Penicillium argentinense]|uniref:Cytochrome P450 n=1 Tax=Penicillium argentinense TaxID=1131581 RepID=A0A9W9EZY0_9EURO|nr:uncharacterized protein N7532_009701 [Penicillium argentinense]KAJ5091017.1 hypothetical protein N7532_009701 [Penicillium argentinense]
MEDCKTAVYVLCFCTSFYITAVIFYRLVLSPLAKFPGPRLAAATRLYEIYYQMIKGGTFTWHISDLHDKYGPVVRITPWEIHIKDPNYYNTVYLDMGKLRNKESLLSCIGYPNPIFPLVSHEPHQPWRNILARFLKKSAILEFEPVIKANIQSLCKHFSTAANSHEPLELYSAFHCYSSDTLSQHAFGHDLGFHYLDEMKYSEKCKTWVNSKFTLCRLIRHLSFVGDIAHKIPRPASFAVEQYAHAYSMEKDVKIRIQRLVDQYDQWEVEMQSTGHSTKNGFSLEARKAIYPAILADQEVPLLEKSQSQLEDSALFLMLAGTNVPSQTIAITMFHILNNPAIYQRLKEELFIVLPDVTTIPSIERLEQIPYLVGCVVIPLSNHVGLKSLPTATIREGLRLESIVTTRLLLSAPNDVLRYQQWDIPAGTFVSMSTYFILRDPYIFPEPDRFKPERWLIEPESLRKLERYLVPASEGTLGCLGQNMNWSWMHHLISALVRRFDLALHETMERNVSMVRNNCIGQPEPGINEVKVNVLGKHSH